jgi:hypothetical protein
MRILGGLCSILCILNLFAEDAQDVDEFNPKVLSDISESAQGEAVSFDGIHGLFGLDFGLHKFGATIGSSDNFTQCNMNLFALCLGLEYAKSFRKGLLIAVDIDCSLSFNGKKEESWKDLNSEYESSHGEPNGGNRTGKLEKDALSPSVAVKCGYLLSKYKSMIFFKVGVSKLSGAYHFRRNDATSKVDFNAYVPVIGLGAERKFNSKLGISAEVSFSMKKNAKKTAGSVEHKTEIERTGARLMAVYNMHSK